jgi:hypothetical protein
VTEYDNGRVVVAALRVDETLKGSSGATLNVIEMRDTPLPPALVAGRDLVAFLVPATRNSYLAKHVPVGDHWSLIKSRPTYLDGTSATQVQQTARLVARVLGPTRGQPDTTPRADSDRALAFDLIAAHPPVLVEDGITMMSGIDGLARSLTSDEQARLEAALARPDLPVDVRTALIETIAARDLKQLVPALRRLEVPALADVAWKALTQLGSPPVRKQIEAQLASADPTMRAAAMQQLLRQEKTEALAQAAQLAKTDPDVGVRVAVVEAIGESGGRDAVSTLEDVYSAPTWETRQAVGRALLRIGGREAPKAFEHMAFNAPADAQRYAVMLLLLSGVQRDDPLVQRVIQSHPDSEIRHLAEHGIEVDDH